MTNHPTLPPGHVAAVLTDLDGVLVDSTAVVESSWRAWALERIIDPDEVFASVHGRPATEVVAAVAPHLDPDAETRWLAHFEARHLRGLETIPGAADCIAAAQERAWAVVTSGTRELATAKLRATRLPVPEVFICADDVIHGKPNPEPYLSAADGLGAEPAACVVVEDAPAGIAAGRAAGMTVFALAGTHRPDELADADLVANSMREVAAAIRQAP